MVLLYYIFIFIFSFRFDSIEETICLLSSSFNNNSIDKLPSKSTTIGDSKNSDTGVEFHVVFFEGSASDTEENPAENKTVERVESNVSPGVVQDEGNPKVSKSPSFLVFLEPIGFAEIGDVEDCCSGEPSHVNA